MLLRKDEDFIDDLTGTYNRRFLKEYLAIEIKKYTRYYTPFTLLFLDIDNFKGVNDTKGHIEGDKVLKEFAYFVKDHLRKSDILVRYGGDEFIVILPHTTRNAGLIVAKRIVDHVKKNEYFFQMGLGVSIGVSQYPDDGRDINELLSCADEGLYLAKRHGKGRVYFASDMRMRPKIPSYRFVNRHSEKEKLKGALSDDRYTLYLIHGDIGIGKTRFVKDLFSLNKDDVFFVKGFNWGHNFPYFMVRELLKKLYNNKRSEFLNLYKDLSSISKKHIARLVPELTEQNDFNSKKEEKEVFLHSIYSFIMRFVKNNPLFIVDDIQWIDEESADFFIWASKINNTLKIIGTHRIKEKSSGYLRIEKDLKNRTYSIQIGPLDRMSTENLIKEILKGEVSTKIIEFVYERSGGNPYYVEEIIRSLFEKGLLYIEGNSKWQLQDAAYSELIFTKSAESVIKSKLHSLSPQVKKVLELIAVYSDVISIDTLSHLLSIGEGELYSILDRIEKTGLIEHESYKRYMFPAGIVRDIILKDISHSKRAYYHRKVLEYFEEFVPKSEREEKCALLAYHYKMIGDSENASKYYKIAAKNARKVFAFNSALRYLKESYNLVPNDDTLFEIANAYYDIGEFNESLSIIKDLLEKEPNNFKYLLKLADIHEILDNIKESEKITLQIIQNCKDDEISDQARMQFAWIKSRKGEYREAINLYKKVVENAKKRNDKIVLAKCYQELGVCYRHIGDLNESEKYYMKALETDYAKSDRLFYLVIKFSLSSVIYDKGYPENAIEVLKEVKDEFKKMGATYYYAMALVNLGACYVTVGDIEKAEKILEIALEYVKSLGNKYVISYIYRNLADIKYQIDDINGAIEYLEKAIDYNNKNIENLHNILYLASLYAKIGKLRKSREVFELYNKLSKDVQDEDLELHKLRSKMEIATFLNEDISDLKEKADKFFERDVNINEIVYISLYISLWYAKNGNFDEAKKYLILAQNKLQRAKNFNIVGFHEHLIEIYGYLGDKNGIVREFNILKDELLKKKNFKKLEKLERKIEGFLKSGG